MVSPFLLFLYRSLLKSVTVHGDEELFVGDSLFEACLQEFHRFY